MKGKWFVNLVMQVLSGNISAADGWRFFRARFASKPIQLSFAGLTFEQVDHILWSIIGEVFVNHEYTPTGFDIKNGDLVVDIGAHKGVFTAYAASRTRAPILAFEPDPENVAQLHALTQANQFENVDIRSVAVAGKSSPALTLYRASSSSRNSIMGIDVLSGQALSDTFEAPAISLDEAISDLCRVDFLKLDCEGAEYEILAGASDLTLAKIQTLALEYHQALAGYSFSQLLERLEGRFEDVRVHAKSQAELGYLYARKV